MKKILIVDDETVIAMSMELLLKGEGYAVVVASNGQQGLEKVEAEAPDLVITDYMMPKMDGIEMIATLRRNGNSVPVLLITSVEEEFLSRMPNAGYDGYLAKPFLDVELFDKVRLLLKE